MYCVTKTARTWDSYKDTLIKILESFNPMSVLEYGPGESTKIIQLHPSVTLIDTIEHDDAWAARSKSNISPKVKLYRESDDLKYPYFSGRLDKYDLIFIDGLKRVECLMLAKFRLNKGGIVVLHDAEREEYKEAINTFALKFFEDEGHTAVLTNDQSVGIKISEILW